MDELTFADLIRMNQLIRNRIDYGGFVAWYDSIPLIKRWALTHRLDEFAYQAGVTDEDWYDAVVESGLSMENPIVSRIFHNQSTNRPLSESINDHELPILFKLLVYLFGITEGRVYQNESKDHCNHWWHRDLLDDRVVQDLLSNPRFYSTSMKDDEKIKR